MKLMAFGMCLLLMSCSSDPEVNQYEKKAMNEEVKSMESFLVNYHEFAEEMERSERDEEKARELERKQ